MAKIRRSSTSPAEKAVLKELSQLFFKRAEGVVNFAEHPEMERVFLRSYVMQELEYAALLALRIRARELRRCK